MKVLVSDTLGPAGIRILEANRSIDVDVKVGLLPEQLEDIIADYHGLIIRSGTKVTKSLLERAVNLKVVGRAGIGVDNVDLDIASKNGVVVMNTPTGNIVSTAEHAISMMMSLTRNIPFGTSSLKKGLWEKKKLQGREVFNKVLGIVGFGKIGSIVADRARGLKMKVVIFDPLISKSKIEEMGFDSVSLDELCRLSDYITIHVPRVESTVNMFDKVLFDTMKTGVMIINCARGGIINELDLYDAIVSGKVFGAALDVFEVEPPGENKLLSLDTVVCTPHLGASTLEAQINVSVMVAEQVIDYLNNGVLSNVVNKIS